MRALLAGRWEPGFLDYHRAEDECRVEPFAWLVLEPIDDLYFVRERSARLVLNYARDVGVRTALRKVASRHAERFRNAKFLSCGYGRVLEGGGALGPGAAVVFVATQHPECVERLVVGPELLTPAPAEAPGGGRGVLHLAGGTHAGVPPALARLKGWSRHSGAPIARETSESALAEATAALAGAPWASARHLSADEPESVSEERATQPAESGARRAVLFGLGNYAKTTVLPNVSPFLQVDRAHEIDPLQIPRGDRSRAWDTSPVPREGSGHDAYLIAGYHAGHADLATEALRRGAAAVIEKPIATDESQLDRLLDAIGEPSRVFACFQRRYHRFNDLARHDLGAEGLPIDYHCVVYEEPLPARHWYRWPSSGTRLLSNGCHWVDHFLWLNDFAAPIAHDVRVARSGVVDCTVELANGAFFTMVLTDTGSRRIGVREHCELRAGGTTVTLVDGRFYRAEDGQKVLRRARSDKHDPYRRMYRDIAQRIASGAPGDSRVSVERSARLALQLDASLRAAQAGRVSSPP